MKKQDTIPSCRAAMGGFSDYLSCLQPEAIVAGCILISVWTPGDS